MQLSELLVELQNTEHLNIPTKANCSLMLNFHVENNVCSHESARPHRALDAPPPKWGPSKKEDGTIW